MRRGSESERLSIYFEEFGAYQHKQNQKSGNGGYSSDEVTEQVFGDQETDVYIPDEYEWE